MTINLYKNYSSSIEVVKATSLVSTITGTLRNGTSIVNPVILVELNSVPDFNYMEIPEFGRKYFVNEIFSTYNNLWEIHAHCDVLSTFWPDIRVADCIIKRNEYKRTKDLVDSEVWVTAKSKFGVQKFPNRPLSNTDSLQGKRYVMVLTGAGSASERSVENERATDA